LVDQAVTRLGVDLEREREESVCVGVGLWRCEKVGDVGGTVGAENGNDERLAPGNQRKA